jgi:hypothetical protein
MVWHSQGLVLLNRRCGVANWGLVGCALLGWVWQTNPGGCVFTCGVAKPQYSSWLAQLLERFVFMTLEKFVFIFMIFALILV